MIRYQPEGICKRVGMNPSGLDALAQKFEEMIKEGLHQGAQMAIYREGELVLKMAGGTDVRTGKPITWDSLFCMRSTTKALTALVMAMLYERGLFSYDDPVARYWPEFARNNKESITIGQVMSHRAGIPQRLPVPFSDWGNREAIAKAIEDLKSIWTPGTANGYHAATYGWVIDELAMRLTGHNISSLLRDEVTVPLGIQDIYIGLPESEYERFCPLAVLDEVPTERAMTSNFMDYQGGVKLPLAWLAGVANAWSLAKVFNIFAFRGTFGGHTFFSKKTQALITKPTNKPGDIDLYLRVTTRWGLGVITGLTPDIYGTALRRRAIGHAGGGANVDWADPDKHLTVAFLCNSMRTGSREQRRQRTLGDLVYASLSPVHTSKSK